MFTRKNTNCLIKFLGPTQIICDEIILDINDKKTICILLMLKIKKIASRDYIASKMWPSLSPERRLSNLRNHLYKVRQSYGAIIMTAGNNLTLSDGFNSDIDFIFSGQKMPINIAMEAHNKQFLNGEDFSDCPEVDVYIKRIAEDYKSEAINAIYQEFKKFKARREISQAITLTRRILQISPFSESAIRLLLRLYVANGDRASAIDIYERFRNSLRLTYGIEPVQKTRDLHRTILIGDRFQDEFTPLEGQQPNDTII